MPRSSRTPYGRGGQWSDAPRCDKTLQMFPTSDMGGTTGGEETATSDMLFIAHRRAGLWGQYTVPEVYWMYWETVEAVDQAQRRLSVEHWEEDQLLLEIVWAGSPYINLTTSSSEEVRAWLDTEIGDGLTSSPLLARAEPSSRSKGGTVK